MSKWVQHISGQGQKWEVENDIDTFEYQVHSKDKRLTMFHYFPTSEYVPCAPPEEWEDVTAECEVSPTGFITLNGRPLEYANFRFTKIDHLHNGPAFIIERRKA